MSMRESISLGQLLMIADEEGEWYSSLQKRLRSCRPAGVLLGGKKIPPPEATRVLLHRIGRALESPIFLALDVEKADALLPRFFPSLPQPSQAVAKGLAAVKKLGEIVGAALSLWGFNIVLGPVLDLRTYPVGPSQFRFDFGSEPARVAECGGAIVEGLRRSKVLSCPRHFPGLASLQSDAYSRMAVSAKSMAALWREDLLPFRRVLPKAPMVLVSTGAYKAYDFDSPRPAVFSSAIVQGLLRTKLVYTGVAVADLRQLGGVLSMGDLAEAALKALQAGCDLLLIPTGEGYVEGILREITLGIDSGKVFAGRVEQALKRIQQCRKGLAHLTGRAGDRDLELLMKRCNEFSREIQ
jgi:beta-N-acetylhexosaminidase